MILHNLVINPGLFFGERGDKRKREVAREFNVEQYCLGNEGDGDGDSARPGQEQLPEYQGQPPRTNHT